MKSPFSSIASSMLRSTTTADGHSTLPGWMLAPLALLAGEGGPPAGKKEAGWTDENLLRRAIALYRAAEDA